MPSASSRRSSGSARRLRKAPRCCTSRSALAGSMEDSTPCTYSCPTAPTNGACVHASAQHRMHCERRMRGGGAAAACNAAC